MAEKNADGPAVEKRKKISKTQQQTLLIALVTSVILGVCGVLAVFFYKYIDFNNKVIAEKDKSIADYEESLRNIKILGNNVTVGMANNKNLESVARGSQADCYDENGDMIDWQAKFDGATDEEERAKYLSMLKMCSALRVIPDALPAQANEEALMSSLNQIFIISDWEPEALSPSGDTVVSEEEETDLSTIAISLSVEADASKTMTVLDNIERSIRTFDLQAATISWNGDNNLDLKASGVAYYTEDVGVSESTKTIYASEENSKKASKK